MLFRSLSNLLKKKKYYSFVASTGLLFSFCSSTPKPHPVAHQNVDTSAQKQDPFAESDPRKKVVKVLAQLIKENPQSEKHFVKKGYVINGDPCTSKIVECNAEHEGIKLFLESMELGTLSKEVLAAFPKLEMLSAEGNQIVEAPDLSENPELIKIYFSNNKLTTAPSFANNPKLEEIALALNQLTLPPDVSKQSELKVLHLFHNTLKEAPDVSHNPKLETLMMGGNDFSEKSLKALKSLKKKHPNLKLTF